MTRPRHYGGVTESQRRLLPETIEMLGGRGSLAIWIEEQLAIA
jgi:hypothetical protein